MTSKSAQHIELCKNSSYKWVQDNTLNVKHVSGKLNPANIFNKEMRDGAHFRQLRDSFMSRLSDFLNNSILTINHASQRSPNMVAPAAAQICTSGKSLGYLSALLSSSFFCSFENISNLSSAGWHILLCTHCIVPSNII
jgi:hypothetical protein